MPLNLTVAAWEADRAMLTNQSIQRSAGWPSLLPLCSGTCRSHACSMRLSSRVKLTCHSGLWVLTLFTCREERTDCLARQVRKLKSQKSFGALTIDIKEIFGTPTVCWHCATPHPTNSNLSSHTMRAEARRASRLFQAPHSGRAAPDSKLLQPRILDTAHSAPGKSPPQLAVKSS